MFGFEQVPVQNVICWDIIIDSMLKSGKPRIALEMAFEYIEEGIVAESGHFCSCY